MQKQEENPNKQPLTSFKYDPNNPLVVGGQAVIEGVMMRAPGRIATAVRRANGEIVVKQQDHKSLAEKYPIFKLPILRGAAGLIEMMFVGIETLNFSADVAMRDAQAAERANKKTVKKEEKDPSSNLKLGAAVLFSLVVGIGIFFVTPLFITTKLFDVEQQALLFNLTAGAIRITILLAYLFGISMMKDVVRLFEYHGAEHKAVFTFEAQADLIPSVAAGYTRFHPRCGTSFVLIVMVVAMLLFSVFDSVMISMFGKISLPIRLATHIPLIPLVGGVSYEFIRWSAKRSETPLGKILVAPGLWLQKITTNEPDLTELEIAVVALKCALGVEVGQPVRYVQKASEIEAA